MSLLPWNAGLTPSVGRFARGCESSSSCSPCCFNATEEYRRPAAGTCGSFWSTGNGQVRALAAQRSIAALARDPDSEGTHAASAHALRFRALLQRRPVARCHKAARHGHSTFQRQRCVEHATRRDGCARRRSRRGCGCGSVLRWHGMASAFFGPGSCVVGRGSRRDSHTCSLSRKPRS